MDEQRKRDEHFLKHIREERKKLMERINQIDRLEVSQLKMMNGENDGLGICIV